MAKYTLGIDVAQKICTWALLDMTTRKVVLQGEVRPEPQHLAQWLQRLSRYDIVRAAVEATGGWEEPVVQALRNHQLPVLIANPKRIHRLREAMGWAKTDILDAQVIALYAFLQNKTSPTPSERQEEVKALFKRREQLVDMLQRERQRLRRTHRPALRESIERSIAFLEEELAKIDQALDEAQRQWEQEDPAIGSKKRLLESVPGVGPKTATALLVWLPELGALSRQEVASLTGTAPLSNDSGQKHGHRRIREGRKRVRRYLYLSAMSTIRVANPLRSFYQHLREEGKPGHKAMVAVMRRLVVILNAIIRTGQSWDPAMAMPHTS